MAEVLRQWLMRRAGALNRPAAVRLAGTLAGEEALQREQFTASLEAGRKGRFCGRKRQAIHGVTRSSAAGLAARFSSAQDLTSFLQGLGALVLWLAPRTAGSGGRIGRAVSEAEEVCSAGAGKGVWWRGSGRAA